VWITTEEASMCFAQTAGVLAAVEDTDLGAASAINDASSRVGGVVMVALVPALLGAGDAHSLAAPCAAPEPVTATSHPNGKRTSP
jgi:hypothetical protein